MITILLAFKEKDMKLTSANGYTHETQLFNSEVASDKNLQNSDEMVFGLEYLVCGSK